MFETDSLLDLKHATELMEQGFGTLPPFEVAEMGNKATAILADVAERMQDNYPYAHPLYAGQMLKPPHPIARAAYSLAMQINPNNHALDGGRASSVLEKEAVANLAAMFGWNTHIGHLCGGGTMANMEALWIAKQEGGGAVVASEQGHYTHSRLTEVLNIPFHSVPVDHNAQMDISALETLLKQKQVGTVVVTLGTTGVGSVDPLHKILELRKSYAFRIHVDAAYGGYHCLIDSLADNAHQAFSRIAEVDSIVIDPHKHGLQPYGCGCVLFRDPQIGRHYKHDSPYTYFSSTELHLGEISLECSRPGAAATALWATQQLLPMQPGGEFALGLESGRNAALALYHLICDDDSQLAIFEPELDIVLWAPKASAASKISEMSSRAFAQCAEKNLHLALVTLPSVLLQSHWPEVAFDTESVVCIRSCLMKPEHAQWVDRIWEIYKEMC
ncbi:MAG: aminotransferase class V-fold PLP-dependent enzyme [Pseudomonadota bacterium]